MLGVAYLYFYFFGMPYNKTNYNLLSKSEMVCSFFYTKKERSGKDCNDRNMENRKKIR